MIVIAGATATGKTELGIKLAKEIGGEVISADSMMVYKYMDIGTAKPTLEERDGVVHHLIDVVYPDENFSVKDYLKLFDKAVKEIKSKGKIPIVVGGSWLYIQTALYGIADAPEGDWQLREKLYQQDSKKLYQQLIQIDPLYAQKIHPNDKRRVVRALEVYHLTGKPFSYFIQKHNYKQPRYDFTGFILERDKDELMHRIEKRVEKMFMNGLVEEVKNLLEMGYKDAITSMQAIGYKELIPFFEKNISLQDAKNSIIKNTKEFAKRQIRTFRNKTNFEYLKIEKNNIDLTLRLILKRSKERWKF